jgi:RNA polymerase sigma factor (sigma-70 family)
MGAKAVRHQKGVTVKEKFLEFRACLQDVRFDLMTQGVPTMQEDGKPLPLTQLIENFREAHPRAQLPKSVQKALSVRNVLIVKNMGLVGRVAIRHKNPQVPHEDMEQAGVLGLIRALEEYDPSRAAFSTFAIIWIRAAVQKALSSGGKADVGGYTQDDRKAAAIYARTGQMPTAKEMKLAPSKLQHERVSKAVLSLDEPARGPGDAGGERLLGDSATYPDQKTAEQELLHDEALRVLELSLDRVLTHVEGQMVRRALLGGETLRDVAKSLGYTFGHAWALKERALGKLNAALKPILR